MLVVNCFMDGLKTLKDHFFSLLDDWLEPWGLFLEPGFFVFFFGLLMFGKIFTFEWSLILVIILDFLNDFFIGFGEFERLELGLDLLF